MQFDPWPIWSKFTTLEQFWPVVDVIKLFWRKSWFSQNLAIEKHFWCQNLHKQSYFQAKLCSKLLMLLKWPILAVMASGEISIFKISSKKSFITSTTGWIYERTDTSSPMPSRTKSPPLSSAQVSPPSSTATVQPWSSTMPRSWKDKWHTFGPQKFILIFNDHAI